MKKFVLLAAIGALVAGGTLLAEEGETPVKMQNLPPAVQKTVKEQSRGASIHGLSREVENGKTYYEAELRQNGLSRDVLIDQSGRVVEVEQQVRVAQLPAAVRSALRKEAAGGKIHRVESLVERGQMKGYEAQIVHNGKRREVKISPDGNVTK